jgi:hypothetical protein
VTAQVEAMYAGPDHGFLIRDPQNRAVRGTRYQTYATFQNGTLANNPTLPIARA